MAAAALLALALLLLGPPPAQAFPNEPEGFGEARLGMELEPVRKLLPGIVPVSDARLRAAELEIETYELADQSVLGLPSCRVRFGFANRILYRVAFDCGQSQDVYATLKKRFGPASTEQGGHLYWLSESRTVSLNLADLQFSFTDRATAQEVEAALRRSAGQPLPPSANAGATPVAPTPLPGPGDDGFEIRGVEMATRYLSHADDSVFDLAVDAIEDAGGPEAVRALGSLLTPGVPRERRLRAIDALLYLHAEWGAARELARALSDPDAEVRQEAAMNIVYTGDPGAVAPLREAYRSESDETTRAIFARALELLGAPPTATEEGPAPAPGS